MEPKRLQLSCLALPLMTLLCTAIPAQVAVSPADRGGLDGSASTSFPLGRHNARVQTLHDDLSAQISLINGHGYRRDATSTRGMVAGFSSDLSVELSISPRSADQPSRTFAANQGAQPTLVLPRTRIFFPATERPASAPATSFDLLIPYAVPFQMPPGGGTLCVDVTIYGNTTPSGDNVNFSPLIDAHEQFRDGHAEQPGYRYGLGCPAPGSGTAHSGRFTLSQSRDGFELDIASRSGIPDDGSGAMLTVVFFGQPVSPFAWPGQPDCVLLVAPQRTFLLPTANDSRGHVDSILTGPAPLPLGFLTTAQLVSAGPEGFLTFSDASSIAAPPLGPQTIQVSRIANSSDRSATTGSTAFNIPVMTFF